MKAERVGLFLVLLVVAIISAVILIPLWLTTDKVRQEGGLVLATWAINLAQVCTLTLLALLVLIPLDGECYVTFLGLSSIIVLFLSAVAGIVAFVFTCVRFSFWWHHAGDAGRAFFVLSLLGVLASILSTRNARKNSSALYKSR